jgi:hypothetical protein
LDGSQTAVTIRVLPLDCIKHQHRASI